MRVMLHSLLRLPGLVALDLSGSASTTPPDNCSSCSGRSNSPSHATADSMQLSSIQHIGKLTGLTSLSLRGFDPEPGTHPHLSALSALTRLTSFQVTSSDQQTREQWSGTIVPMLCSLRGLRVLHIRLVGFRSDDQADISALAASLTHLTDLTLHHAVLTQRGWSAVMQLQELDKLRVYAVRGLTHTTGPDSGPVVHLSTEEGGIEFNPLLDLRTVAYANLHRLQLPLPGTTLFISPQDSADTAASRQLLAAAAANLAAAGPGTLECEHVRSDDGINGIFITLGVLRLAAQHGTARHDVSISFHEEGKSGLPVLFAAVPHLRSLSLTGKRTGGVLRKLWNAEIHMSDLEPTSAAASAAAAAPAWAGPAPSTLHAIARLPSLSTLNLSNCWAAQDRGHLTALSQLSPCLTDLALTGKQWWSFEQWDEIIIPTLCSLCHLQRLKVSLGTDRYGADDEDHEVVALATSLPLLTSLNLPHHIISEAGIEAVLQHLTFLTHLTVCDVRGITGSLAGAQQCSWKQLHFACSTQPQWPPQVQVLAHLPLQGVAFSCGCAGLFLDDEDEESEPLNEAAVAAQVSDMIANLQSASSLSVGSGAQPNSCSLITLSSGLGILYLLQAAARLSWLTSSTTHVHLEANTITNDYVTALAAVAPAITHLALVDCTEVAVDAWASLVTCFPRLAVLELSCRMEEVRRTTAEGCSMCDLYATSNNLQIQLAH